MSSKVLLTLLTILSLTGIFRAAEPNVVPESPRLVPYVDYRGDLWTRPGLTGDWGGTRQDLMEKGLRFDASLIEVLQRNLAGGTEFEGSSMMNLRYGLQLDTDKMDLWPGGIFTVRGMSRYGDSDNLNTGSLVPVNTVSLYPMPEQDTTTLTDLYYTQFLSPQIGLLVGKMCPRDENVFASDETSQFLNTGFNFNPVIATTIPLSFNTAGLILLPTDYLKLTTLVLDSEGSANQCGFPETFERGTSVYQMLTATIKPWDLTGHQRVGWTYSDKSRIQFSQTGRNVIGAIITGDTSGLERKSNDWSFIYDFDQYVYNLPDSQDRGFGLFGRFGCTSGEVNPTEAFYSLGVGGKGLIPGRQNDNFGVGFYYLQLSDKLPRVIQGRTEDEQGVEIFYNVAVTPWLHVTPDLQVINPVRDRVDTTYVAGLRAKIDF